jgi:hypothetical protein
MNRILSGNLLPFSKISNTFRKPRTTITKFGNCLLGNGVLLCCCKLLGGKGRGDTVISGRQRNAGPSIKSKNLEPSP